MRFKERVIRDATLRTFRFVFEHTLFAMFQIEREYPRMRRLNRNTQTCKLPKKYNPKAHTYRVSMRFDTATT
jgi:hypothetical protein